ncbi:MAG TPA: hypothetical protein PK083_06325 [Soehngenia sp.]|nr:hypothetical protein [Soehngenia sp.]HPP32061.1 hypothetical protein [Soehngenia sp.]
MSNTKKIILTILAIALVVGVFFGINKYFQGSDLDKTIYITIINDTNGEVLMEKTKFKTEKETLGDFLEENKEKLNVKMTDTQYGRFLDGLLGLETADMTKGPWWMYTYKSEEKGLEMKIGEAPGVDSLGLNDGDEIEFHYTIMSGM